MAKIRTSDGRLVDPLNITPADVIPSVMIHAICLLNRFTGHTVHPYTVGQHTLNLVRYVPKRLKRAALVHDFQEAWFNDMASPLKAEMQDYKVAEKRAGVVVAHTLGVTMAELDDFDNYDKRIYLNERNALFPIIEERGMGDDRKPLADIRGVLRFEEQRWWFVRDCLAHEFENLFPEHAGNALQQKLELTS